MPLIATDGLGVEDMDKPPTPSTKFKSPSLFLMFALLFNKSFKRCSKERGVSPPVDMMKGVLL